MQAILQAREQRSTDRLKLQAQGLVGISLSLNIAGYPKSNPLFAKAFRLLQSDLERFLLANRVLLQAPIRFDTDAAGDFYLAGVSYSQASAQDIKVITERFEAQHSLQRLIDVDVMDAQGQMVSSHKLKKCLICNEAAKVCTRNATHPLEEIRAFTTKQLQAFVAQKERVAFHHKLSAAATQALLYELSLSPKPGLVHKNGTGSHTDMDFLTFVNAISALAPHWQSLCTLSTQDLPDRETETEVIRQIGLLMEQDMRTATQGINTHKGAIFALGYLVYLSAKLQYQGQPFDTEQLRAYLQLYNANSMQDSLLHNPQALSHGQRTFKTYGAKAGGGARQQMALGLPVVFETALPYLEDIDKNRQVFSNEHYAYGILEKVLLLIMAHNYDSNILHRSDLQTLEKLQYLCKSALTKNKDFDEAYKNICHFCSEKNISPGGSADMLAATIFIYKLKHF